MPTASGTSAVAGLRAAYDRLAADPAIRAAARRVRPQVLNLAAAALEEGIRFGLAAAAKSPQSAKPPPQAAKSPQAGKE